jgi:hypothetical protein
VIFCELWYGSKPDMDLFLSYLVADLLKLEEGIPICINNEEVLFRARVLVIVMDIPARATSSYMNGHTGKCSCSWCLNKGKRIKNRY